MHIDVTFTPADYKKNLKNRGVTVIIDVLRASSSIITAFVHGACQVIPVRTPEAAFDLKRKLSGEKVLLCGERSGKKITHFDFGNSPREYMDERVGNKKLIFCSTNGSQLMSLAAGRSDRIVIGGFINYRAVLDFLLQAEDDIVLGCAGREGKFSLEDTACAGMFVHGLMRSKRNSIRCRDAAYVAELIYLRHKGNLEMLLQKSEHGQYLISLGFGEDLSFCAQTDRFKILPVFHKNGFVVR